MNTESIYTVIITIITVFGSTAAWRFYEKRMLTKEKNDNFIKNDCRERIEKLEDLLRDSSEEKDEMREKILELTSIVSSLNTKVEFLEKENEELLNRINGYNSPNYVPIRKKPK